MALVKIDKVKGTVLDYLVARSQGRIIKRDPMGFGFTTSEGGYWVWEEFPSYMRKIGRNYAPSTDPSMGSEIIWGNSVSLERKHDGWWVACIYNINDERTHLSIDEEPLVASLRTCLKSVYGDEVEVPDELLKG